MAANDDERYLRPEELALRWNVKVQTLANWRAKRGGPPYSTIGGVRYRLSDIRAYEDGKIIWPLGA